MDVTERMQMDIEEWQRKCAFLERKDKEREAEFEVRLIDLTEKIKWLQKRRMQQENTRGGSVVTRVNNKNIASQVRNMLCV